MYLELVYLTAAAVEPDAFRWVDGDGGHSLVASHARTSRSTPLTRAPVSLTIPYRYIYHEEYILV